MLYEQHELMGWGHGADAAAVNDASTGFRNRTQHEVMFEFVAKAQPEFNAGYPAEAFGVGPLDRRERPRFD